MLKGTSKERMFPIFPAFRHDRNWDELNEVVNLKWIDLRCLTNVFRICTSQLPLLLSDVPQTDSVFLEKDNNK
ncbi:hypothetical protein TNCV_3641 [Trichonephila clavipes]|nr:hypothetical protein TNCV_3641 [Trichonephila clavipes]